MSRPRIAVLRLQAAAASSRCVLGTPRSPPLLPPEEAGGSSGGAKLETATGARVHGLNNGRHTGSTGTFSVRTVYPVLSRERPDTAINVWPVRISRRVFLGDFVQYVLE
jgi:hypothetical protein